MVTEQQVDGFFNRLVQESGVSASVLVANKNGIVIKKVTQLKFLSPERNLV